MLLSFLIFMPVNAKPKSLPSSPLPSNFGDELYFVLIVKFNISLKYFLGILTVYTL